MRARLIGSWPGRQPPRLELASDLLAVTLGWSVIACPAARFTRCTIAPNRFGGAGHPSRSSWISTQLPAHARAADGRLERCLVVAILRRPHRTALRVDEADRSDVLPGDPPRRVPRGRRRRRFRSLYRANRLSRLDNGDRDQSALPGRRCRDGDRPLSLCPDHRESGSVSRGAFTLASSYVAILS